MNEQQDKLTLGQIVVVHPTKDSSTWYLGAVASYETGTYPFTHIDAIGLDEGGFYITGEEYLPIKNLQTQNTLKPFCEDELTKMEDELYLRAEYSPGEVIFYTNDTGEKTIVVVLDDLPVLGIVNSFLFGKLSIEEDGKLKIIEQGCGIKGRHKRAHALSEITFMEIRNKYYRDRQNNYHRPN